MVLTAHRGPVVTDLAVGMQTSLFGATELHCRPIVPRFEHLDPSSSVCFEPGWVEGSDAVFEMLRAEMPWRSMERPMYDRVVNVPRLICTVDLADLSDTHPLAVITQSLEKVLATRFPSVGLNYYRTGQDSVAWHRDSIKRTGRPTTVALVSLGSPRTLAMRPMAAIPQNFAETTGSTAATRHRWRLGHGDLFVMEGACQRDWEHCVPKERRVGPRISLAFRSQ